MPDRRANPRPVRAGAVSVVVASHRSSTPVLGALTSVRFPAEGHEIVVVGPPPMAGDLPQDLGAVRFVDRLPGSSVAAALNRGAASARGEYLAFLDATARPEPEWIAAGLGRLRANCRVAAVASVLRDDEGDVVFAGVTVDLAGTPVPTRAMPEHPAPVLAAALAAQVVEARAFRWVGGFDADGCRGVEDVDLGWRLWLAGFEVWCDPASVVIVDDGARPDDVAGRLTMLAKNFDDRRAGAVVAAAQRILAGSGGRAADAFASDPALAARSSSAARA